MLWWEVLEVDKNASEEDVLKAYRRLAKKYHPDLSQEKDANEKMANINRAYEEYKSYKENPTAYSHASTSSNNRNTNYGAHNGGFGFDYGFDSEPDFSFFHENGREGFYGHGFYYEHNPKNYRKARQRRQAYKAKYYKEHSSFDDYDPYEPWNGYDPFDDMNGSRKKDGRGFYYGHNSKKHRKARQRRQKYKASYYKGYDYYDPWEEFDPFSSPRKKKASIKTFISDFVYGSIKKIKVFFENLDFKGKIEKVKKKITSFIEKIKQERIKKEEVYKEEQRQTKEKFRKTYGTDSIPKYETMSDFITARTKVTNKVCRKFNFGRLDYNEVIEILSEYKKSLNQLKLELENTPKDSASYECIKKCINDLQISICVALKNKYPKLTNEECIILMEWELDVDVTESHFCDMDYHEKINNAYVKSA